MKEAWNIASLMMREMRGKYGGGKGDRVRGKLSVSESETGELRGEK